MTTTQEKVNIFARAIEDVFNCILLTNIPKDAAYEGHLDLNTSYALDNDGYHVYYLGLLRHVFQLPNMKDKWSEDGIQELGHELLLALAESKRSEHRIPDFLAIAKDWLDKIDVPFQEYTCYTAVTGLSVENSLRLGEVTFLPRNDPLQFYIPELDDDLAKPFLETLHPYRSCISSSKVTAEWRRANQIHLQKTEQALNILRFISSLILHDQATRHIYLASRDPKRISESLW